MRSELSLRWETLWLNVSVLISFMIVSSNHNRAVDVYSLWAFHFPSLYEAANINSGRGATIDRCSLCEFESMTCHTKPDSEWQAVSATLITAPTGSRMRQRTSLLGAVWPPCTTRSVVWHIDAVVTKNNEINFQSCHLWCIRSSILMCVSWLHISLSQLR